MVRGWCVYVFMLSFMACINSKGHDGLTPYFMCGFICDYKIPHFTRSSGIKMWYKVNPYWKVKLSWTSYLVCKSTMHGVWSHLTDIQPNLVSVDLKWSLTSTVVKVWKNSKNDDSKVRLKVGWFSKFTWRSNSRSTKNLLNSFAKIEVKWHYQPPA